MKSKAACDTEAARYYREFGRRLSRIRATRKITEEQAAALIGITVPTYRRWEAGGRPQPPRYQGIMAFARKHRVKLKYLFEGTGPYFAAEDHWKIKWIGPQRVIASKQ
jgi:transcriptional regulator with XRE-family HTH domain